MRIPLSECAKLVRSKNAGPFWLTIDVMFDSADVYRAARDQQVLDRDVIATIFKQDREAIKLFNHDHAFAIKLSFPRPLSSGSPGDSDVFGGQQYAPLLDLTVEIPEAPSQ
jgi:Domain of unknown function (DUF4387)